MGCWLFSEPTLTSKVTFLKFNQAKSSINVCSTIGLRIRSQDIETYEKNGEIWVTENSGGISTFANQGVGKNWWKLDQETTIPDALCLINDYGNHWAWEPAYTMKLDDSG
jgi:hypothetical protein